jgi:hypothetical protein
VKRLIATSPAVLGGVAAVTLVAGAGAAIAAWRITSKDVVLTAQTATLSPGNKPDVRADGNAVTVKWEVNTFGERGVDSYRIKRYEVGGVVQAAPHGGCEQDVVKNECTDTNVPPGQWQYTVVPVKGTWTGPESEKSSAVLVADDGKAVVVQKVPEQGPAGPAAGLKIVETGTPEAATAPAEPTWTLQPGADGVLGKGDTLTFAGATPIEPGAIIKGWDGKRRTVSVLATPGEATALLTVKDGETTILGPLAVPAAAVPAEVTFPAKLVAARGRILIRLSAPPAAPAQEPAPAPKDDAPPTQPEPPATPADPTPSESSAEPTETTKTTETTTPADPPAGDESVAGAPESPATETTASGPAAEVSPTTSEDAPAPLTAT